MWLKKEIVEDHFRSCRLVSTIGFISIFLAGCVSVHTLDESYGRKLIAQNAGPLGSPYEMYRSVQERDARAQDPNTNVVVTLSGGGLRAANFSMGALLALESTSYRNSNLLLQTDYFSTVSGGGLATALVLAGMLEKACEERHSFSLIEYLNSSAQPLKALRTGFATRDGILSSLSPKVALSRLDRGDVLQSELAKRFLTLAENIDDCGRGLPPSKEVRLGDIFVPIDELAQPTTPYVIANATNVLNGEIVSFTPQHLANQGVSCFTHHLKKYPLARDQYFLLPFAAGVRSSANFPVGLTPATFDVILNRDEWDDGLCSQMKADAPSAKLRHLHLTDGGAADNLGLNVALELLNYEDQKYLRIPHQDVRQKQILVVVDAFNGSERPTTSRERGNSAIASLFRSANLPLASFRHLVNGTLLSENALDIAALDALSTASSVGVGYVNMNDLPPDYRSVGTVVPTARGISEELQRKLIVAGYVRTVRALGSRAVSSQISDELRDLLTGRLRGNSTDFDEEVRRLEGPTSNLVKFDRSERSQFRAEIINKIAIESELVTEWIAAFRDAYTAFNLVVLENESQDALRKAVEKIENENEIPVIDGSAPSISKIDLKSTSSEIVDYRTKVGTLMDRLDSWEVDEPDSESKSNLLAKGEELLQGISNYELELEQTAFDVIVPLEFFARMTIMADKIDGELFGFVEEIDSSDAPGDGWFWWFRSEPELAEAIERDRYAYLVQLDRFYRDNIEAYKQRSVRAELIEKEELASARALQASIDKALRGELRERFVDDISSISSSANDILGLNSVPVSLEKNGEECSVFVDAISTLDDTENYSGHLDSMILRSRRESEGAIGEEQYVLDCGNQVVVREACTNARDAAESVEKAMLNYRIELRNAKLNWPNLFARDSIDIQAYERQELPTFSQICSR